jgi:uncharacterized membrane protein (DUF2068 family)
MKIIIKTIGILLIALGAYKGYVCMRTIIVAMPIAFENGLQDMAIIVSLITLGMVIISLGKVVGGIGLLWLKPWAKWTASVAAVIHIVLLVGSLIAIWIITKGEFHNSAKIPFWKDYVTIGVNLAIVIILFLLFRKNKIRERHNKTNSQDVVPPPEI